MEQKCNAFEWKYSNSLKIDFFKFTNTGNSRGAFFFLIPFLHIWYKVRHGGRWVCIKKKTDRDVTPVVGNAILKFHFAFKIHIKVSVK